MRITTPGKWLLGILTIGQLFIGLGLIIWFVTRLMPAILAQDEQLLETALLGSIQGLFVWIIAISLLSFGLLVFYIVHAGIHPKLSNTMRIVWIVLFLLFGSFVEVVYFFMEILPRQSMTARLERNAAEPV